MIESHLKLGERERERASFGGRNPFKISSAFSCAYVSCVAKPVRGSCYKVGSVILIKLLTFLQRHVLKNSSIYCDRQISTLSEHPLTIDVKIFGVHNREASYKIL